MKLIIAGSRHLTVGESTIRRAVALFRTENHKWTITEIVSGGCPTGADAYGEHWAEMMEVPIKRFPADWAKYGKSAGPRRNQEMADYADGLLLIWDGESRGSRNILHRALMNSLPTLQIILTNFPTRSENG